MFNCRALILSFIPIEIVPQRDLRWWTKRQILPFIQFFSTFQSFSSHKVICWKCSLKNNCVRSCLIELQSFFDDSKINIDPKYPYLDAFSKSFAHIGHDAVQSSQYSLDLCGLRFLDQARRTQIVFCLNSGLQVSIHC